jgi:hypothetical protein
LTRKFNKWRVDNFTHIFPLAISFLHPIGRIRLETQVTAIRLKELPSGFRVLSTEFVSIESLPEGSRKTIRDNIHSNKTNGPDEVWCTAIFDVESIDATSHGFFVCGYVAGEYSDLADGLSL